MHRSSAAFALAALALTSAAAILPTAPAVAAALPCEHTYSSGVVNTFISFLNPTGPTPTVSTIDVPEDGLVVDDIDVLVNVTHPAVWELKITLVSLTDAAAVRGTTKLTDITPGAGANLHGTVFDDAASIPLGAGVAPYTGRFRPFAPLRGLTGVSGGAWQLQIVDAAPGDDGGFD